MTIECAHPLVLILIPILLAGLIFSARFLRSRNKSKKLGEIVLRALVLTLITLSLAGISIKKSSDLTTTIFLADLSDSTKASWDVEADFIKSAISKMGSDDQAGVVVFGSDAKIEQFVSDKKIFTEFQSSVSGAATNLEQAVQTAMALFPADSARRLVLITDGSENMGNLSNAVSLFTADAGATLELKVLKLDREIASEVYVSDVTLPETISEGDEFQVKVSIYSSQATNARVSLYSGRSLKGEKEVALTKGINQLVFKDKGVEGGLKSYRVTVDADVDTVTVNNTYSAYTRVEARSRILVVEGDRGHGNAFFKVLDACNYAYDVVTPKAVPVAIADLSQYQSVVFLDVYADDLRKGFLDSLETYVKDYAGGFVCLGGPNSYALGGYRDTAVERILPVNMDLEGEKQIPKIAMTMVIDHSGSMSSPASDKTNITCMDVAKQAAINALDSLRNIDQVGVLAFDDSYTWVTPLADLEDKNLVTAQISTIQSDGGTSIYPALAEAVRALKKSDAVFRHVVLLTDGQDGFRQYDKILDDAKNSNITISTVAVGTDADAHMLKQLAEKGQGRYYYSDAGSALPRIFAQEVFLSTKSYLINEEFLPVITNSHEVISGIFEEGTPSLYGYVATTPKAQATVVLQSHREDPILALWQYGLGRSVAFTSDGSGEWTGNFTAWEKYPSLWKNLLEWTISKSELGSDILTTSQEGNSAVIHYETKDYGSDTKISAVITGEDGKSKEVTLKAVMPGVYETRTELGEVGVYTINVRNSDGGEVIKNFNTATAMQYSLEYRYADVKNVLDQFVKRTDGHFIDDSSQVFDSKLSGTLKRKDISDLLLVLSLLLFMLDILARRLRYDWLGKLLDKLTPVLKKKEKKEKKREEKSVKASVEKEKPEKVKEAKVEGKEEAKPESKKEKTVKEKPVKKKEEKKPSKKKNEADVIDTAALLNKKKNRQ